MKSIASGVIKGPLAAERPSSGKPGEGGNRLDITSRLITPFDFNFHGRNSWSRFNLFARQTRRER
jgi:hypothetical protein